MQTLYIILGKKHICIHTSISIPIYLYTSEKKIQRTLLCVQKETIEDTDNGDDDDDTDDVEDDRHEYDDSEDNWEENHHSQGHGQCRCKGANLTRWEYILMRGPSQD